MLKCPFCKTTKGKVSGKDTSAATRRHTARKPKFYVRCTNCNARGPIGRTEEEAVKLWKTEVSKAPVSLLDIQPSNTVLVRFFHQGAFIADLGVFTGEDLEYCKQRALTFAHSEATRIKCNEKSHGSVRVITPEDEHHPIWTSNHLPDNSGWTYEAR
ncbi:hypothetical protein D0S45_17555 [Marinifilum sp. JC120]|nr:hypothetical protein D0S45_17555 [Marinifilum sp. JC120]